MSQIAVGSSGGSGGDGDVVGPASAVNGNFASFSGTTGKIIQDSGVNSSDFQPASAALDDLENLSTFGVVVQNGAGSTNYITRLLAASGPGISVSNTNGATGNPTYTLDADLQSIAGLSTAGLAARGGAGTWATRTITVTSNTGLSITNGNGSAGNPTLAGIDATTSVKGVASFNSDQFSVSSGAVSSKAGLFKILTQTASNTATIDFTDLTSYDVYFLTMTTVGPELTGESFQMQVSSDNGSTWQTTNYANGIDRYTYNSATNTNTNSTSFIPLSEAMKNNTYVGQFYIFNTNVGSGVTLSGGGTWQDNVSSSIYTGFYLGQGPTGVNAIRFKYSSGNIANGDFTLYGVS